MADPTQLIDDLVRALVDARGKRARLLAGWRAGARKRVLLGTVHARAPELLRPEMAQAVLERLAAATESEKPGLRRLAVALIEELAEGRTAGPLGARLEGLAADHISVELERLGLPDAMCERPTCSDRVRRLALARGEAGALERREPALAERIERLLEARTRLDLGGEAAWSGLLGLDLGVLSASAELLLRETQDATVDLLEFRKRRARVDGRAWHDVELALELLDLREHISPGAVQLLGERLARDLGLDPTARGRITLDLEPRSGRFPGLEVAQFGPDELAVVSAPMRTPADLDRLVRGQGEALHRANIDAPELIDRALLDGALPQATALLWASVLGDPGWHRRMVRLPARPARDASGAFSLRLLVSLRVAAARFLVARELELSGPTPRVRELHRERLGKAVGADVPGHGAFELTLREAAEPLRAFGLLAQLQRALLEGFNEDWWRNPHATELLQAFWRPGGAVKLQPLLGDAVPLERAAKLLVERAAG